MVQYFIDKGYDVNFVDFQREYSFADSSLSLAVNSNYKEIVELLLLSGADVVGVDNCSALELALSSEHISDDVIRLILKNLFDKCGSKEQAVEKLIKYNCRLHQAAFLEDPWVIERLLKRGVEIDACHWINKETALHISAMLDDVSTLKLLVQCKANIQALDHKDANALYYVYMQNKVHNAKKLEMLEILLNQGLVPTSCTKIGVFQGCYTLVYGDCSAVQVLLQSAIDFTAKDLLRGMTILHYLAINQNPGLPEVLRPYVKKFHVNAVDMYNATPLYYASMKGHVEMLKFLLAEGAEVDCTHSIHNYLPLHLVYAESIPVFEDEFNECAKLLLQNHANPQIVINRRNEQVTIFDVALGKKKVQPIIAQIALLANLGTKISDIVQSKINSQRCFKKYLRSCHRMLRKRIAGSITVSMVLHSKTIRLAHHISQQNSLWKLKNLKHRRKLKKKFSYYYSCIKNNITRATKFLERKAIIYTAVCWISGGKLRLFHQIIIDNIVEHLEDKDLDSLYEVGVNKVFLTSKGNFMT